MKKFNTFLFLLIYSGVGYSQNTPCNTDQSVNNIAYANSGIQKSITKADNKAESFRNSKQENNYDAVITIPVVVHVVYNTGQQNISDAQILSEIDVLNEDFRKLNPDTVNIRPLYKPIAGDAKIQFCLAQRDPQGNATNGITRTFTSVADFGCDDQVKFDTAGGKNGWNPHQYLNIWVCCLNCANGYAYYPGIPDQYDGVVIHYYVFGRTGYVAPGYQGRTTTHEIGHWLGLYHPFYFDNDPCEGNTSQTCSTLGDKVCDTPKDSTPTWDCNPTLNTCIDYPVDLPDMYENFMDYTTDSCRTMFTLEQIDRMNSFLYTSRLSLFTSLGCVPPDSSRYDASVLNIQYPTGQICKTTFSPVIEIGNGGTDTLTQLSIHASVDGGIASVLSYTGPLPSACFDTVALAALTTIPGNHQLKIWCTDPNLHADEYTLNDTVNFDFYIMESNDGELIPFSEDFEGSVFPPSGWFVENTDNDNLKWEKSSAASGYGIGNSCAYFQNAACWPDQTKDYLLTTWFNLTSYNNAVLYFDYAYSALNATYPSFSDTMAIYYSTDCTTNWIKIWEKGGNALATAPATVNFASFVPDADEWGTDTISLSGITGNSLVQFRFENRSGYGNNLYIDNINLNWPSGINDTFNDQNISIYPNPAKKTITIQLQQISLTNNNVLTVYDNHGQLLLKQNLSQQKTEINISNLSKGLYLLKLENDGNIAVKKFIKE
jgi:hypothetical protein